MEHKVHDRRVYRMAVSGDRIVTCDGDYGVARVSSMPTCLLVLLECYYV